MKVDIATMAYHSCSMKFANYQERAGFVCFVNCDIPDAFTTEVFPCSKHLVCMLKERYIVIPFLKETWVLGKFNVLTKVSWKEGQ